MQIIGGIDMDKKQQTELSSRDIRNSLLLGLKYVVANLFTSFILLAMHFIVSIIMGLENKNAADFLSGSVIQTVMLPLVVLYYGHIAYNDGYRHSVADKYDKRRIYLAMIPIFASQVICVLIAIRVNMGLTTPNELNPANLIAKFLLSPFTILFNAFPLLMPELMLLPCVVPPIAMYIGYHRARFVEVKDHTISQSADEFRKKLEEEQYKYDNIQNDGNDRE